MFQQQQKALKVALAPFTVLTGLWLATPSMAIAEETNASLLEEITVTARRREESLFETPVSVRAFTNQELDQRQIEYSYQIAESTPNLVFRRDQANSTGANVYIRGIGQSDFNPVVQPGVGIYVDGEPSSGGIPSVVRY
jgi:iron complex outermembrane receptor protein